jgi:hypothetical protein
MAQSGYTPIQLYYSTTAAAVPVNTNLANGELAINITDGKLYYKDNTGTVKLLAGATAGPAGGSNTQVQFNSSGVLAGSANMTFDGTILTAAGFAGPINGTIGATTANTGAFTTVTATGNITSSGILQALGTVQSSSGADLSLNANGANRDVFVKVNGTTLMTVQGSTANVGIGTSSPLGILDVRSTTPNVLINGKDTGNPAMYFGLLTYPTLSSSGAKIGYVYGSGNSTQEYGALTFSTATSAFGAITEWMRIAPSGNVGVGTTTPAYKFEVASGTAGQTSLAGFRTADTTTANNAGVFIFATPSATAANRSAYVLWDADGADVVGSDYFYITKAGNSGNVDFIQQSNAAMTFQTNAVERLRIASTGAFGLSGANYGTSGQVLTSGGSGAAPTWTTVGGGGGSPGGSNTQVQFNNSGAFGGASGLTWNGSLLTANSVVSTLGSYDTGISVLTAAGGAYRKWNFIFTPGLLSYIFILSTDYEDSVVCLKNYGSATITFLSGNITGRFIATSSLAVNSIMVFSSAASYAVSVVGGASLAPNVKFTALNCAVASYNREY